MVRLVSLPISSWGGGRDKFHEKAQGTHDAQDTGSLFLCFYSAVISELPHSHVFGIGIWTSEMVLFR